MINFSLLGKPSKVFEHYKKLLAFHNYDKDKSLEIIGIKSISAGKNVVYGFAKIGRA